MNYCICYLAILATDVLPVHRDDNDKEFVLCNIMCILWLTLLLTHCTHRHYCRFYNKIRIYAVPKCSIIPHSTLLSVCCRSSVTPPVGCRDTCSTPEVSCLEVILLLLSQLLSVMCMVCLMLAM